MRIESPLPWLLAVLLMACSTAKPVAISKEKVLSPDGKWLEERVVLHMSRRPKQVYHVYQDSSGNFIRHGSDRNYYLNGQMKFEEHYREGKLDSITEFWYESGAKQGELPFKDGKPHGMARTWHPNGKKKSEKPWEEGQLHGVSTEWDKQGRKVGEVLWERNAKAKILFPAPEAGKSSP